VKKYRKLHAPGGTLAMFVACYLYLPSASAGMLSDTEWKVTRGDTLYAISRAVYPGDAQKRGRLRRDIIKLNPSVFADGANNMGVGVVLKLPPYVSTESVAPKSTPSKVTPKPDRPSVSTGESSGNEWKVRRGDTLYLICRTIYPGDARKQARLGRDIKKLNPSVFVRGANNMGVGDILKLPDYVELKSLPSEVGEPAPVPIPDKVTPSQAVEFVAPAPVVEPQPEVPTVKKQPSSSPSHAEGSAVVSLGFSYGGEKLVDIGGGPDIFTGNGAQLRLGYEQMFQHGSGYRASLGLQYYTLLDQRDVTFRDTYLQLAYQYRANPVVYGIGVVFDAGATLKNATTTEFDPAIGAVVYMEHVGSGKLSGWGLSFTSLNIEEKISGTSVNASRSELYYSWRF
jgi:LysM repeat protein